MHKGNFKGAFLFKPTGKKVRCLSCILIFQMYILTQQLNWFHGAILGVPTFSRHNTQSVQGWGSLLATAYVRNGGPCEPVPCLKNVLIKEITASRSHAAASRTSRLLSSERHPVETSSHALSVASSSCWKIGSAWFSIIDCSSPFGSPEPSNPT